MRRLRKAASSFILWLTWPPEMRAINLSYTENPYKFLTPIRVPVVMRAGNLCARVK
jgi:hypothetical protein